MKAMNLRPPAFVLFVGRGHPLGNELHLGAGLLDGNTRLQLAIDEEVVGVARTQFPTERQGKPGLRVPERKVRSRRHDSDHRLRLGTQGDATADDIRVATKVSLPE